MAEETTQASKVRGRGRRRRRRSLGHDASLSSACVGRLRRRSRRRRRPRLLLRLVRWLRGRPPCQILRTSSWSWRQRLQSPGRGRDCLSREGSVGRCTPRRPSDGAALQCDSSTVKTTSRSTSSSRSARCPSDLRCRDVVAIAW